MRILSQLEAKTNQRLPYSQRDERTYSTTPPLLIPSSTIARMTTQHNSPFRGTLGVSPPWLEVILRFSSSFSMSVELTAE